jgi:hypothetical protein
LGLRVALLPSGNARAENLHQGARRSAGAAGLTNSHGSLQQALALHCLLLCWRQVALKASLTATAKDVAKQSHVK